MYFSKKFFSAIFVSDIYEIHVQTMKMTFVLQKTFFFHLKHFQFDDSVGAATLPVLSVTMVKYTRTKIRVQTMKILVTHVTRS